MNQNIGNVGLLNMLNATPESIKGIERIGNVGMAVFRKGMGHLLTELNIGNIGKSLEIPEGYSFMNGMLNIDESYLQSIQEPANLVVNGIVIIDKGVQPDQLKTELLTIITNGKVYTPPHLAGSVSHVFSKGGATIKTYHGAPPRTENGEFTLTNSFLSSFEEPQYLIVNGILHFPKDLDMDLFNEKISNLEVSGIVTLFENQESFLYKKAASLTSCRVEIYPDGYEIMKKSLRLNGRSIRRFQNKKIFTKKPIIIDADVARDSLTKAFATIQSTSIIICHEEVEDLVYELCSNLDSEVLTYEHGFVMIEGDEVWSNDQFFALEKPMNFIVKGKLTLDQDVEESVLQKQVATLDILGEVHVPEKKLKGTLQNLIRINTGTIDLPKKMEATSAYLGNIGELTL